MSLRSVDSKVRQCGLVGLVFILVLIAITCVTTNILLSLFVSHDSQAIEDALARWLGSNMDTRYSHLVVDRDVEIEVEAYKGTVHDSDSEQMMANDTGTDLPLGEPSLSVESDSVPLSENMTERAADLLVSEGNETQPVNLDANVAPPDLTSNVDPLAVPTNVASLIMPSNGVPAAIPSNGVPPAVNPGQNGSVTSPAKPWWWVDFQMQNETYLAEVDNFIFSQAELHDFSLKVNTVDIDNLHVTLPPTIPNMRNPCWLELVPDNFTFETSLYKCHINYRRLRKSFAFLTNLINKRGQEGLKWRVRCFPAFFLIGVAKCGTTDLYEAMTQHPDIITSELKEPEYWSRQRYGTNPWLFQTDCDAFKAQATFADYLDTYDNASEAVRRSFLKDADGTWHSDVLFGDFSTHTMEELFFWDRSYDEPKVITAHHIHNIRPETKFIVIFRDPVERAYSRYKMRYKNRGNVAGTTEDFHQRMVKQVNGINECLSSRNRRVCVYTENIGKAGDHTILVNGMYMVYLQDWLDVFPQEQFMILRFEDYIMDRMGHIEKIVNFLGLNSMPESDKEYVLNMPAANAGISIGGGMMNETKEMLQNFFRPFNQELIQLTGDERFSWDY